jgi:hypothetical protein
MPGQVSIAVTARQSSAFFAQVARTLLARQTLPGPVQSAGGAGQVQAALGADPAHGLPAEQELIDLTARQPFASSSQVISTFPWQEEPAPPEHAAGGAAHEQLAEGWAPVQGLPDGQVVRAGAMFTQPSASLMQVATVVVDSQKAPAPFAQPVGGAGQLQAFP